MGRSVKKKSSGRKIKINRKPLSGAALKRYQRHMAKLAKQLEPIVQAIKDSKRITAEDMQKRINI